MALGGFAGHAGLLANGRCCMSWQSMGDDVCIHVAFFLSSRFGFLINDPPPLMLLKVLLVAHNLFVLAT